MLKRQRQRQIRRRLQRRHLQQSQLFYQAIRRLQRIPLNLERAQFLQKAHQRRKAHLLQILEILLHRARLLHRHRLLQRARLLKEHHLPLQREPRLLQRQIRGQLRLRILRVPKRSRRQKRPRQIPLHPLRRPLRFSHRFDSQYWICSVQF